MIKMSFALWKDSFSNLNIRLLLKQPDTLRINISVGLDEKKNNITTISGADVRLHKNIIYKSSYEMWKNGN